MLEAIAEGWRIPLTDEQRPEIEALLAAEMTDREAAAAVARRPEACSAQIQEKKKVDILVNENTDDKCKDCFCL